MYAGRAVESGPARAVLVHAGASLYALPAARQSIAARRAARALRHAGPDAELAPAQRHVRLPFRAALSAGRSGVPPRRAAEHCRSPPIIMSPASAPRRRGPSRRRPAMASRRTLPSEPLLQVEALQKHYAAGGGLFAAARNVAAVKQATFSIAENEFVALVGESGSGKSTIAKNAGRPGAADGRTNPARWRGPHRSVAAQPRAARRELADGVPGSAIGAQSAAARGEHRHPGDGGRQPARELGRAAGARPGSCSRRSACRPILPRGFPANFRAASASASILRARCARCRKSWSPTKSCPASMSRSRRSSSTCWRGCAPSSASPCCSSPTICPSCVICAAACW